MKDLTGQRFGRLVAIEPTEKRARQLVVWRCQCDCGNTCEVVGSSLTKGNTRSCGCLKSVAARDVSGQRFGKLVAIEPTEKRHRDSVVWTCQCDCGNVVDVPLRALTVGDRKTCGKCSTAGDRLARDIAGQRFGKLVAVRPTEKRQRGSVVWECQCDCGNICEAPLSALASGHKKSCGCLTGGSGGRSARRDLAGQRFGRLTAVRPTDKRQSGSVVWECICDCGNACEVAASRLVTGRKKSCGCLARGKRLESGSGQGPESSLPSSLKDLSGQRFGDLTAVRAVGSQGTHAVWECVCDCGNTCEAASGNLSSGRTKSCGCRRTGRDPRNIAGKRFGKLVAVEITDQSVPVGKGDAAGESPVWRCLCDCDRVVRASARDLALGRVSSCGEC